MNRALCFSLLLAVTLGARAELPQGERGMVATAHPLASKAGLEAMERGGNAIDAAVAAALTLGVVDGFNSGIGGGCFLLIRTATGECFAIDGRETAPRAATREMFVREGKADPRLSQIGALAAGVPGALAGYELALRRHGKLSLSAHLRAAAEIAEHGFLISARFAANLKATAGELAQFESSRSIFFNAAGEVLHEGQTLRQPELAATYRAIAEHGVGWFYRGGFAEATARWMSEHGGLLTVEDFAGYEPRMREPLRATYRGFELVSFPPPSSGGVHMLQILNVLEHFDLRALGNNSADTIHVITEAMKLAFADRAHWLGDPDFTPVPRGLLAKDYAAELAGRIDPARAITIPGHGKPPRAAEDIFGKHTTHLSAADAGGNWVACTATINTAFGSKVVIPGTGVLLNNEMDDFSIGPGVPNAFGLIGGDANAVAPGKRPLSSMSPTFVFKDGQPLLAVGAAGGPTIISQTLLVIVNTIDFDMDLGAALASPRFHHQWRPDELRIETGVPEAVRLALRARGHRLVESESFGACQAAAWDPRRRVFSGAHDPRIEGGAAGW